jgi:hypothetical protein
VRPWPRRQRAAVGVDEYDLDDVGEPGHPLDSQCLRLLRRVNLPMPTLFAQWGLFLPDKASRVASLMFIYLSAKELPSCIATLLSLREPDHLYRPGAMARRDHSEDVAQGGTPQAPRPVAAYGDGRAPFQASRDQQRVLLVGGPRQR